MPQQCTSYSEIILLLCYDRMKEQAKRDQRGIIHSYKYKSLLFLISKDIASAIRQDHGIAVVLSATAQAFDHHTANVHDSNIGTGAITSLLHALDHVSRKVRVSQSPLGSTNEAKTLLIAAAAGVSALEMTTTRCSSEVLEHFVRCNCNDLLPSLASSLSIFSAGDSESPVVRRCLLQKITNTIAVTFSVNLTDIEIHPQAVHQCCSALTIALQNEGPGQIRRNCIAVLLNFSSSTDQVRDNVLLSAGLLDTLISLLRSDAFACTSRCIKKETMSILLNLSVSRGDSMASNEELQLLLIDLMTKSSSSFIISTAALILHNLFRSLEKPTLFCSDDDIINALVAGIDNGSGDIMGQMACVGLLERFLKKTNHKCLAKYRHVVPTLIALAARGPCSPDTKEAAIEAIVLLSRTAILI